MTDKAGRYVLIGLGGVGSWLVRLLAPYVAYSEPGATLLLVDGDVFEVANRSRMAFTRPGPKAVVLAGELAELYGDRINLVPVPRFVNARNSRDVIAEGDVVFSQPDNHATRRVVERRCMRLGDVALFSGGNDDAADASGGTFGNVQAYIRKGGADVTNPISAFHPEIARPADRVPNARGCTAETASNPQLLFTNAAVAAAMLAAFYAWRTGRLAYEEAYLDIVGGAMTSVRRELRSRR
jgi:hypothetical protein